MITPQDGAAPAPTPREVLAKFMYDRFVEEHGDDCDSTVTRESFVANADEMVTFLESMAPQESPRPTTGAAIDLAQIKKDAGAITRRSNGDVLMLANKIIDAIDAPRGEQTKTGPVACVVASNAPAGPLAGHKSSPSVVKESLTTAPEEAPSPARALDETTAMLVKVCKEIMSRCGNINNQHVRYWWQARERGES